MVRFRRNDPSSATDSAVSERAGTARRLNADQLLQTQCRPEAKLMPAHPKFYTRKNFARDETHNIIGHHTNPAKRAEINIAYKHGIAGVTRRLAA